MIEVLIYHLHVVAFVYAYVQRWQREGVKGGLLGVAIVALVFVIGWSLTGAIARLLVSNDGPGLTSDTLSLLILLPLEVVFFYVFFLQSTGDEKVDTEDSVKNVS